ncbi:hypothetical protein NDU88_010751 [Pleurodeles waltl]|uniref:Uncharacterized protein n=1 Tax=Pleurodeles waltl TaxID=8319 RepID=A0AAV7R143_PLEWA|nr:hypothetical protein NDU88_010751 [Pleurodeles waltl]
MCVYGIDDGGVVNGAFVGGVSIDSDFVDCVFVDGAFIDGVFTVDGDFVGGDVDNEALCEVFGGESRLVVYVFTNDEKFKKAVVDGASVD